MEISLNKSFPGSPSAWEARLLVMGNQRNLPVTMAALTSPIAWVISISRGQHSVQL
jgi:hypothetical protein